MKRLTVCLLFALSIINCTNPKQNKDMNEEISQLKAEIENLNQRIAENPSGEGTKIATFLTFQKEDAEQAMNFYISLFENSKIIDIKRWGNEGMGKEGTIMHATFKLGESLYMCSDSPPIHDWDFTPAVSSFVECENEKELERLFEKLSENGTIMMPLNNYGFSQKFGFLKDKFGVSWQLNLQ